MALKRTVELIEMLGMTDALRIADVGANPTHAPPYQPLLELDACHVWGFEPNKAAFGRLSEQAQPNRTIFNAAVGEPGPATYYAHHISSLSSLFPIKASAARFLGKNFWNNRPVEKMDVSLVGLDMITELPLIDVLKMDLQGGELGVLKGGREKLTQAVAVIPEIRFYRMYEDEPMWAEVDQELRSQGFVLHKIMHAKTVRLDTSQKHRIKGKGFKSQLLDGDAVYIRNLEDFSKLSTRQCQALALACDAVFQSHDLCLFCLDELVRRQAVPADAPERYTDFLLAEGAT